MMCRANLMATGAHDTGIGIKTCFQGSSSRKKPGTGTVCRLHQFSFASRLVKARFNGAKKCGCVYFWESKEEKARSNPSQATRSHEFQFQYHPNRRKRSHQARGGHRPFGGFPFCQMKCGPQPSCPDMKDDKNSDDQGIFADSPDSTSAEA